MSGEGLALLAALFYGLAGVAIIKGKPAARGDNGVFLSVLMTAGVSAALWLFQGQTGLSELGSPDALEPLTVFVAAGLFSMVLGRTTMYRATEQIGPVATSLLRRLSPVFALPLALVFLAEVPRWWTVLGVALVIGAVMLHIGRPTLKPDRSIGIGWLLGIGSAAFYAVSYTLRSHGLDLLPDAALGTFIGALAGLVWLLSAVAVGSERGARLRRLLKDRGPWHLLTAVTLSAGQICQFYALQSAPVVVVATLGSLEVFFAALLSAAIMRGPHMRTGPIWGPAALAALGTALLIW
ncbi:MAG: DMT family transporter [Roseovarius sp.]|nr:DMT family transporter [Roseovarius sp.]